MQQLSSITPLEIILLALAAVGVFYFFSCLLAQHQAQPAAPRCSPAHPHDVPHRTNGDGCDQDR